MSMALVVVGCRDDNQGNQDETVLIYGTEVLYRPQYPNTLPSWMTTYIQDAPLCCFVIKGRKDGNVIYNIWSDLSSSTYGWFFDKDGKYLSRSEDFFKATNDWFCIYYDTKK